jgi:hypothetical protein
VISTGLIVSDRDAYHNNGFKLRNKNVDRVIPYMGKRVSLFKKMCPVWAS